MFNFPTCLSITCGIFWCSYYGNMFGTARGFKTAEYKEWVKAGTTKMGNGAGMVREAGIGTTQENHLSIWIIHGQVSLSEGSRGYHLCMMRGYKQYNHFLTSSSSSGIETSPKLLLGTANIDPIQNEEIECIPVTGSGRVWFGDGFQACCFRT